MTTIVSGFLTNINKYRSIEKYIDYGKKLCKINNLYINNDPQGVIY